MNCLFSYNSDKRREVYSPSVTCSRLQTDFIEDITVYISVYIFPQIRVEARLILIIFEML